MIEIFSRYKNLNKVLVIITSIAFIGGMVYTFGSNFGNVFSNYVIKVGDITFSKNQYLKLLNRLKQEFPNISQEELKKLVLTYLISRGLVLDFAQKNNIYISNKFVKEFIAQNLLNTTHFDPQLFSNYAHKMGYSPEELFKNIKNDLLFEKAKFYLAQAPYVTNLEAKALYQLDHAKRNFKILEITPFYFKVKINKKDIIEYLEKHPEKYSNFLKKTIYYKKLPVYNDVEKIKKEILRLKNSNTSSFEKLSEDKFIKKFGPISNKEGVLNKGDYIIFYKVEYTLPQDIDSFPPKLIQDVRLSKAYIKMQKLANNLYEKLSNNTNIKLPKSLNWKMVLYNKDEFIKNFHLKQPDKVIYLYIAPENLVLPPLETQEGIILVIPGKYYFINNINNTELQSYKNKILSYKQNFIFNYFINTLANKVPIQINKDYIK